MDISVRSDGQVTGERTFSAQWNRLRKLDGEAPVSCNNAEVGQAGEKEAIGPLPLLGSYWVCSAYVERVKRCDT